MNGIRENVENISSDHIKAFVADNYTGENTILAVTGDVEES